MSQPSWRAPGLQPSRPRAAPAWVCSAPSSFVAATGAGELRLRAIDAPGERIEPFEQIDARAVLLERPRAAGSRMSATVRLESGAERGAKLLAVTDGGMARP